MTKFYSVILLMFLTTISAVRAQISVTSVDQTYTQNFNSLANSGASNAFGLSNWTSNKETYNGNDGALATGTIYSYGTTGTTERALGSLNSGSNPKLYFGTSFKNETSSSIGKISVTYTGEQWRNGNKNVLGSGGTLLADSLVFQYSLNATSAADSNATWTSVNALTFITPTLSATESKLDGNASANKRTLTAELGIPLAAGQTIAIRWANERSTSSSVVGSRHGLAIDDLTVTFGEGGEEPLDQCENPLDYYTDTVNITVAGTTINVTFPPVDGAVGYIVFLDDVQDFDEETYVFGEPEDGVEYTAGQFLDDSKIVYVGTNTSISIPSLKPDNDYEVSVFPIFNCEDGVVYGDFNSNEATTSTATGLRDRITNNINIYPNPVSGNVLNVRLDASAQGKANVQIFNVLGTQVYSAQQAISSNTQLRLPNALPAGRYTLRIEQDGAAQIGSFIVVK